MVDLGTYKLKKLITGKITPEESFTIDYAEEVYESEHLCTAIKRFHLILDTKYERADLHEVMENKFQHLTITQRNELLKLL